MPTFVSTTLGILDEEGIAYGDDIVKTITPLGLEGTARYFRQLGVNQPLEALMQRIIADMCQQYRYHIQPKPHVKETLLQLKARGCSLNILTASPHMTLDPCLKRLEMYDLFDNVWSCDDFETTKADPEIYRMAAKRLHVSTQQVLFLDDNLNADKTAKDAGMQVCGVYDDSSADLVEQMRDETDYYIFNFSELLTI